MSAKSFIIGAQLESVTEELNLRENILKKVDTASGGTGIRVGSKYLMKRDLLNQIEELRAQKKALEEQLMEMSLLNETLSKVPKSKFVKLGSKGL